jgi:hypothetical protein
LGLGLGVRRWNLLLRKKIGLAIGMGGIKVRLGKLKVVFKVYVWCCAFSQNFQLVKKNK